MRPTYDSSQRERSRQRNFREPQYSLPRDVSPDDPYLRPYSTHQFAKKKRVKFNDQEDIRVFRKEDQSTAKSLSEEQILGIKKQIENEVSKMYDFNWEQKKHFDALSQQNSMKEQKQKQKELYEKLMGMKQQIDFYTPFLLALPSNIDVPVSGSQSYQKQAHAERIKDVLGCYYTQLNQIPNQPIFQVSTQTNKNQPKIIFFHEGGVNQGEQFIKSNKKLQKQLKSILKMPGQTLRSSAPKKSQQRQISPRLLWLLKDMQVNKQKYNKQMTQMLLKPYKDSGQLQYWMTNQQALNEKLKNQPVGGPAPPSNIPVVTPPPPQPIMPYHPGTNRMSPSPSNQFRPQFSTYDPLQNKQQKFKTIPCKYFHSPQGCVKTQNCTFIHDPSYRGIPHPLMANQQFNPPFPNRFENRGGFSENQTFHKKQHFQNFGGFTGHQGGGHYNQHKHFHHKKFDHYQHNQGQFQQPGYNPQQNQYQGYNPQQNYGQINQQMGQKQQNPGFSGYQNPQQPMNMYYNQGQGGNMGGRNSNER